MNVLVVALDAVTARDVDDAEVLVVAPALNSWLRRWLSDEDAARRRAQGRAAALVERLEFVACTQRDASATPTRCSRSPTHSATFRADEIVIAAEPGTRSQRTAALASRARSRFGLPTSTQDNDQHDNDQQNNARKDAA